MAVALGLRKGDHVEVWSNSQKVWIPDGVVLEVAQENCIMEGYSIPAGAIKVSYGGVNSKWILPPAVADSVRRPAGAAAAAAAAPAAPAAVCTPLPAQRSPCKFGCGRPVQPGMTRGMKPFDTCCKKCAKSGGGGEHDDNCGGARPDTLGTPRGGQDPKRWLQEVLSSEEKVRAYTQEVLVAAAEGGFSLTPEQVRKAVEDLLMKPIGVNLECKDSMLDGIMKKYDPANKGHLDLLAFEQVVRLLLEDRNEAWFPQKLPAKAMTFVRKNPAPAESVYTFGDKLGEGSFGIVHSVTHRISGEKRVCKKIAKLKGKSGMTVDEIIAEIESMAMLDHPNVIKVYEYFEDKDSVSQIMEPCYGGELQDRIDDVFKKHKPGYSEAFICDVMKQTLRALAFMHSERFMHKDLKPQNIMLCDKESSSIKVIDFGLAELFEADHPVSENFGGTLLYMAPEVFRLELTTKVDVWSAGCILYNLVTGDYPFMAPWPLPPGKDMDWWQAELERVICQEPFRPHKRFIDGSVSPLCKSLLEQMLIKDPRTRPDAATCLEHPWFKSFSQTPPPLSVGVTQCLEAYSGQPELKKAIFLLIAHQCTKPVLTELREVFTHFDVHNRGALTVTSFHEVLRSTGISSLQAERIVHALDKDDSGTVEWTEFIAAALCISVCGEKKLVDAAFAIFDADGDGEVSVRDFEAIFARGDVKDLWYRQLPSECQRIGSDARYTREQFQNYMGRRMRVTGGDLLAAVV